MRWAERRPRRGLLVLIGLLHLALLGLLSPALSPRVTPPGATLITLRWLPATSPKSAAPKPAATPQQPAAARPTPPTRQVPLAAPPAAPMATPAPPPDVTVAAEAAPPDPAASTPQPLLLNTEATRRAVRMMAREPLLSERVQTASGVEPRETPQARLSREVQQAGRGDCNRGEFAGGGAGLLSLPFYLIAEIRGACAK